MSKIAEYVKEKPAVDKNYLLTIKDVAEIFNVKRHTIHEWRRLGKFIPAVKIGRSLYFKKEDLDKFIEDNKEK